MRSVVIVTKTDSVPKRQVDLPWLKAIPAHWQLKPIGHLVAVRGGCTPSKDNRSYWNGDVPWVTPKDMKFDTIHNSIDHVTESALHETGLALIEPPVVLIVVRGMILLHTFPVGLTAAPVTINQDMKALVPRREVEAPYLAWALRGISHAVFSIVEESGHGTRVLRTDLWKRFPLPFPPLDEQRAIAAFLDRETAKIDELIGKKRRLTEVIQKKRFAVITECVVRGIVRSKSLTDTGIAWLGQIPSHWKVAKFKRAAFFQEGPGLRNWQFTDSGVRVICVTNITESGIDFDGYAKFISEDEYFSTYRHFTVQRGDVLLSSSGNSWGKVAEFDSAEAAILNTSTIRINQNVAKDLSRDFLKWTLQTDTVREQLRVMMTGACQPNFGPSHLARVWVAVPPTSEQSEIAAFLDTAIGRYDNLTRRIGEGIQRLQAYRSALISAAVTGQIDVRHYRPEAP